MMNVAKRKDNICGVYTICKRRTKFLKIRVLEFSKSRMYCDSFSSENL